MKKALKYCFNKWWRPLLFFFMIAGLNLANSELKIHFLNTPLYILTTFSVIVLWISLFYQLFENRFLTGCLAFIVIFAAGVISMMITLIDGDHWADELEIPIGIQIENPINMDNYTRLDQIVF